MENLTNEKPCVSGNTGNVVVICEEAPGSSGGAGGISPLPPLPPDPIVREEELPDELEDPSYGGGGIAPTPAGAKTWLTKKAAQLIVIALRNTSDDIIKTAVSALKLRKSVANWIIRNKEKLADGLEEAFKHMDDALEKGIAAGGSELANLIWQLGLTSDRLLVNQVAQTLFQAIKFVAL